MSENNALLGADPELFVQSTVFDQRGRAIRYEPIPIFGLIGGTKDKPNKMGNMDEGFMYLEDNAALEFNVPPAPDARTFVRNIQQAKSWITDNLLTDKKLMYSDSCLLELGAKHNRDPRSQEVGCSVDFDAYDNEGAQRKPFDGSSLGTTRYAGGHFHVAYNVDVVPPFVAARFLDLYLSLPWLEYDRQQARRQTYGKAGLFRPKAYGVEYRTMSNWWLWTSERALENLASSALKFARQTYEDKFLQQLSDAYVGMPWDEVKAAVETEDYGRASRLIDLADRTYNLGIRGRRR